MKTTTYVAVLCLVSLALGACARPAAPPPEVLSRGLVETLIDTGFYTEVRLGTIIGRHHKPGEDRWQVIACYDFALLDGNQGSNCVDTFSAYRLHNGNWVVSVTINDVYRWRAISLRPGAGPEAAPGGPAAAPGEPPAAPADR